MGRSVRYLTFDGCFIGPAARMQLKKFDLTVQFKMEPRADPPLSPDDQAFKTIREAAKQLGLNFETVGQI